MVSFIGIYAYKLIVSSSDLRRTNHKFITLTTFIKKKLDIPVSQRYIEGYACGLSSRLGACCNTTNNEA